MPGWRDHLDVEPRRAHRAWLDAGRSGPGRIDLRHVDVSEARFGGARLDGARFEQCRLDRMAVDLSTLHGCEIVGCAGAGGALYRCELFDVRIERTALVRFNLSGSHLNRATVADGDFTESGFERATIIGCRIANVSFGSALMRDAFMRGSEFVDCDFRHADLGAGAEAHLASFEDSRFVRCDFRGARLAGRIFKNTTFEACRFHGIDGRPVMSGPVVAKDSDLSATGDGVRRADQARVERLWRRPPARRGGPRGVHFTLVTRRPVAVAAIEDVLRAFERHAPPDAWGLNRADEEYAAPRVAAFVSRCRDPLILCTWRGRRPRPHVTWLSLSARHPGTLKVEFSADGAGGGDDPRAPYDLADALAEALSPDFAALGPLSENGDAWDDVLGEATNLHPEDYAKLGPCGPAVRTYLGARLVTLIGARHIEAAACATDAVGNCVRLDLLREPWTRAPSVLLPRWHAARVALAASGVFGTPAAAGPRWSPPDA